MRTGKVRSSRETEQDSVQTLELSIRTARKMVRHTTITMTALVNVYFLLIKAFHIYVKILPAIH